MKASLVLLFLLLNLVCWSQGLLTTNGVQLKTRNGVVLVFQNASITNNGTAHFSEADVFIRGTNNQTIGGTGINEFKNIVLDKAAGQLILQSSVNVTEQVNFTRGIIDLNNQTLNLSPQALIVGESDTKRFIGLNGGEIVIIVNLNAPSSVNPGNLGFTISSPSNLGFTTIKRGHKFQIPSAIQRYYEVIPENNSVLNANIAVQYFDAELNGFNENFLTILRKTNNNFQDIGKDALNTTFNFVGKTNVNQMGIFTLTSGVGAPLPVKFVLFNSNCETNGVVLNWKTGEEINTKEFVIEKSTDGTHWTYLSAVAANGNTRSERTYSQLVSSGNNFYRIVAIDFDGKKTYSTIIKAACSSVEGMQLWPNPVLSQATISIKSEKNTTAVVRIYDTKGSLIKQVQKDLLPGLNQFAIDMSGIIPGHYIVVARCGDRQEKFGVIKK